MGKYALEIKIADKLSLRNLIGQALTYKQLYPDTAVIIVDTGRMNRPDILEFVQQFQALGVRTVILDGVLHRPKKGRKGTTIRIG